MDEMPPASGQWHCEQILNGTEPIVVCQRDQLTAETVRLRALLRDVVVAANRMRDGWAEGSEGVKAHLWLKLHGAAEAAGDEVRTL